MVRYCHQTSDSSDSPSNLWMVCLCVCAKIRRPHSLSHYFHWQHPLVWSSLVTERLTKATAVFINLSSGFARRRRSSNCSSGRFLSAHSNLFHLSVLHQSRPNLPRDIMLRIESPKSIDFMSPLEKIKRSRWRGYRHMQIPTWTPQGQLLASRCATGNVWSLGRAADVLKRLEDIDDIGGDVGGSLFDLSEFQIKGLPQCDPTIHATVINVNMCIYII